MGQPATGIAAHRHFAALNSDLKTYNDSSLAVNSKQSYATGKTQFINFCATFRVHELGPILPTTETILCYSATYLAKQVRHGTIKTYLSAVKHFHLQNNYDLQLHKFIRLHYLLRGIKRFQGDALPKRKPIGINHLELFYKLLLPDSNTNIDNIMLWAAICLAFFGFLRISEFTGSSAFDPTVHLMASDICFQQLANQVNEMQVNIKSSKTDPFRKGVQLSIGKTGSHICPIAAMQKYLHYSNPLSGPLFQYKSGRYLSRSRFTEEIRCLLEQGGYKSKEFAGHSFRIGVATTAASANFPPWLIKALGRWASDCYEIYVQTPKETLVGASKKLLN